MSESGRPALRAPRRTLLMLARRDLVDAAARRDPHAVEHQRCVRGNRVVVVVVMKHADPCRRRDRGDEQINRLHPMGDTFGAGELGLGAERLRCRLGAQRRMRQRVKAFRERYEPVRVACAITQLQQRRRAAPQLSGGERSIESIAIRPGKSPVERSCPRGVVEQQRLPVAAQ